MSIIYSCRHCGHSIGALEQTVLNHSDLGLDILSEEEKREMIHYEGNGDIHIKVICESCESLLKENPKYHELDYFIQ